MFCYSCKPQIQKLTNKISFKLQHEENCGVKETEGFISIRIPPLRSNQESSTECNKLSVSFLLLEVQQLHMFRVVSSHRNEELAKVLVRL